MKISKRSLKSLRWLVLTEMLCPVLMIILLMISLIFTKLTGNPASGLPEILWALMTIAVWAAGSVAVYGITELSHCFTYSWYLHLMYFLIKAASLMINGFSAASENSARYEMLTDALSSVQQLAGMLSHVTILLGFCSVLKKAGDETLCRKCRRYSHIYSVLGFLILLSNAAGIVLDRMYPGLSAANAGIYVLLMAVTAVVSVPVFLTIKNSSIKIYDLLCGAQEV